MRMRPAAVVPTGSIAFFIILFDTGRTIHWHTRGRLLYFYLFVNITLVQVILIC